MGNDRNDVTQIHFWGGETLIQVDLLEKNVPKFYELFPNIKSWHISTNWVININNFFTFLKTIDNCAHQETKIVLQVSIDGPPGTISDNGHDGWNMYLKNFKEFATLMNNYKMHHVKVEIHLKSTLSKELYLSTLSTYEGLKNYMTYMSNFLQEVDNLFVSESVWIRESFTLPTMANPHIYSKEEGEQIRKILNLWDEVEYREFNGWHIPFLFGLNEYNMDRIIFESNIQCGEFLNRFTINFDGTIVECSGVFIDYYEPYKKELLNQKETRLYEEALINTVNSLNPLKATDEEIKKWKWRIQKGYRGTYFTYLSLMMGVAKELCASKQISSYYENEDMLFKDLSSFQNSSGCSKENFQTTGVPYLTSVGNLREYFNGVMEYGSLTKKNLLNRSFKYEEYDVHPEQGKENKYEYNVGR